MRLLGVAVIDSLEKLWPCFPAAITSPARRAEDACGSQVARSIRYHHAAAQVRVTAPAACHGWRAVRGNHAWECADDRLCFLPV